MNDKQFFRPEDDDEIYAFVKEWQRNALLEMKADCEKRGKNVKEIMVEDNEWDGYVKASLDYGEDPEEAWKYLQRLVDEVEPREEDE